MLLLWLPYLVLDGMLKMYEASLRMGQPPKKEPTIIMLEEEPPEPAAIAA
jgi:hypothetical protein